MIQNLSTYGLLVRPLISVSKEIREKSDDVYLGELYPG